MKKIYLIAIGAVCSLHAGAQDVTDDFDSFMSEELASFDSFIDDANKQFISFLRNPWKEFEASKPVVKRVKPEPDKPLVFDKTKEPANTAPVQLSVEEILGKAKNEGKQRGNGRVSDGDKLTFDKPAKKGNEVKPVDRSENVPGVRPIDKPVTKPIGKPVTKPIGKSVTKPVDSPVSKPVAKPTTIKPENDRKPATPSKPSCPFAEPSTSSDVPASSLADKPAARPTTTPQPSTNSFPSTTYGPIHAQSADRAKISYLGQDFYIDNKLKGSCSLGNLSEKSVANAYESMCKKDSKQLLSDCRQVKRELRLNDWGLYLFIKNIADAFCQDANSSVVMQQFILNELGYRAKMARQGDNKRMLLFVVPDCKLYGRPYFTRDGVDYYNLTADDACSFYMCENDSPKAKNRIGMSIGEAPALDNNAVHTAHKNASGTVSVAADVPKQLIEFYKSIPQCDYSVYVNAKVNSGVANSVLSALQPVVKGKSEKDAANLLINFVQTGFKYATDQEQFGYEKPFFVEELFYYPACDCEDRAVLYSYLVRNLLGLDVVLLDYPNHIATAVHFNEDVPGDFVSVGGKKYIVCDPTYIGAPIGKTMPQFKNVAAKVLKY